MPSEPRPCKWCGDLICIRQTLTGKPRPFNRILQPPEELTEAQRWVPQHNPTGELIMVQVDSINPARLTGVRWYATTHYCPAFLAAARSRTDPTGFADLTDQLLKHFAQSDTRP